MRPFSPSPACDREVKLSDAEINRVKERLT